MTVRARVNDAMNGPGSTTFRLSEVVLVLADEIDKDRAKQVPTAEKGPLDFRAELGSLLGRADSHETGAYATDVFLARFIRKAVKLYDEILA